MYALSSKIDIKKLPIPLALKLFDALIKPILLYASQVWEPFVKNKPDDWDKSETERTYTQFLKQLLGVSRSTTRVMGRGELEKQSTRRYPT